MRKIKEKENGRYDDEDENPEVNIMDKVEEKGKEKNEGNKEEEGEEEEKESEEKESNEKESEEKEKD